MKLLAIDYGEKRAGLALADTEDGIAFPRETLANTGRKALMGELLRVVEEEHVEAVVLGLPATRDGAETTLIRQIKNVAHELERAGLAVHFMDETLSSFEAEEDLRAAGLRGDRLKKALDSQAAARILESFLNSSG
jgi:putative holliday junction resolvase